MKPKSKASGSKDLLFEGLPYEVIWLDEFGNINFANKKWCQKLGFIKTKW